RDRLHDLPRRPDAAHWWWWHGWRLLRRRQIDPRREGDRRLRRRERRPRIWWPNLVAAFFRPRRLDHGIFRQVREARLLECARGGHISARPSEAVGGRLDPRARRLAPRLRNRGGFPRPQDIAHAVRDVGPLVVGVFRLVRLLDMGAVWRPEYLLVVGDQLRAGHRDFMANRLAAAAEQKIDQIHSVTIRRVFLRNSQARPQTGHGREQYLIVRFAGLRVDM